MHITKEMINMGNKLIFGKRLIKAGPVIWAIMFISLVLLPVNGSALEVGDKAPDFYAVTIEGKEISYARDLEGKKPVCLIFWTTWCPHCQKELPLVEKLYKEFGENIEFIGINLGFKEKIAEFVKKYHITLPIAYDEGDRIATAFGAKIQTNILIDKKGVIIYDERGFQDAIRKHMEKLLAR